MSTETVAWQQKPLMFHPGGKPPEFLFTHSRKKWDCSKVKTSAK
jgi:hypothetical protein